MKLKKVSYVYSEGDAFEKKALDEISLEIPDGQFIGIIGHTGSGKSTLIQHFNALIRPTSGTITYNGEDIWGEKYDRRALRSEVGLYCPTLNLPGGCIHNPMNQRMQVP